jgi:hypothetical protein
LVPFASCLLPPAPASCLPHFPSLAKFQVASYPR